MKRLRLALIHFIQYHPITLYTLILVPALFLATVWNLSFQYQQIENTLLNQAQTYQNQLKLSENKLTQTLLSLRRYYLSSSINLATFESLTEAYADASDFEMITFSPALKHDEVTSFEKKMQIKGFEACHLHPSIMTPIRPQHQNQSAYLLPVEFVFPYRPEHTAHICEDFSPFLPSNTHTTLSSLFITHQHESLPTLLITTPLYLSQSLNALISGTLNYTYFNKKLENTFNTLPLPSFTLQLFTQNHLIAHYTMTASQTHWNPTIFTVERTQPLSFFGHPMQLKINGSWTLKQVNPIPLMWSILFTLLSVTLILFLLRQLILRYHNLATYKARLKQLINNTHDAIIVTDEKGLIKQWSPAAETLLGYAASETDHHPITQFLAPNIDNFDAFLSKTYAEKEHALEINTKAGEMQSVQVSVTPIQLEQHLEYFWDLHDVTQELKQAKQIKQLAYYDSLTGLENRAQFKENITHLIAEEKNLKAAALLFLDLDGFKQVNDTLGHEAGDELLKIIALRLRGFIDHIDRFHHLCRFGGDEFIMFIPFTHIEHLEKLANRILKSLQRPIHIPQGTIRVSASIGIALYPENSDEYDVLMRRADSAMYAAKSEGKNRFAFYHPSMEEQLNEYIQIEQALKPALKEQEFFLVYQPKINTQDYTLHSFEALIRWVHPEMGFIPPDKFISIAEESDFIIELGEWIIDTAITQLHQWQNHPTLKNIPIAVNLSSKQIIDSSFFEKTAEKLHTLGLPTHLLELELTERTIMTDVEDNIRYLNAMTELGFKMAVDDFGTGYSSLSYLKRLPISTLKIDKSFVDGLPHDEHDQSIATSIINLAKSLKLHTVAEGVETMEQFVYLCHAGCEVIQGYLFSRPLKVNEVDDWLETHQNTYNHTKDICCFDKDSGTSCCSPDDTQAEKN